MQEELGTTVKAATALNGHRRPSMDAVFTCAAFIICVVLIIVTSNNKARQDSNRRVKAGAELALDDNFIIVLSRGFVVFVVVILSNFF
jgi:uncharacterized membrane protein YidH (DUF202 family)